MAFHANPFVLVWRLSNAIEPKIVPLGPGRPNSHATATLFQIAEDDIKNECWVQCVAYGQGAKLVPETRMLPLLALRAYPLFLHYAGTKPPGRMSIESISRSFRYVS